MLVYNNTREEIAPAVLLDRINRDLLSSVRTTYYFTAICAIFDTTENSIVYSRAGHPKPIVIHADGADAGCTLSGNIRIGLDRIQEATASIS